MAQFQVGMGTDLFGTKHNINLEFQTCPSMSELINAVESQYDVEMRSCRPAGYPDIPFKVQTFQLYDDVLQRWVDLYSSAQLTSGCTVYCFQPESVWHSDAQGIIPDPAANVTWTTPTGSPRRARVASDAGVAPTLSEKLRSVFFAADTGNKGYVLYADLKAAFQVCDMEFTYATVGELFTAADANQSGHITYDEWVSFAIKYPAVIDALFFRSRDVRCDQVKAQQVDAAAQAARQVELQQLYQQQQWAQPAAAAAPPPGVPSPALRQCEEALVTQRAVATAAAQRQAALQDAADQRCREAAEAEQQLNALWAQIEAQRGVVDRECAAARDTNTELEAARLALQQAAARQADAQAQLERLRRHEHAEMEMQKLAAQKEAEEAQRQRAAAEAAAMAAQQRAAEIAAQEAAQVVAQQEEARKQAQATAEWQAEYERARQEADGARMQKELAERREREAWDRLYYQPNSPPGPAY